MHVGHMVNLFLYCANRKTIFFINAANSCEVPLLRFTVLKICFLCNTESCGEQGGAV